MSSPIRNVSDTAFWVAYHRALETDRPDALFRDPFARRLAGEHGRRISEGVPTSRIVAWTVALRTRIIDDYIELALRSGIDTVLCLGAGLDARPYRMSLPAQLRWIEADYPHVIDYKEGILGRETAVCRLERFKVDLADATQRQKLLNEVDSSANSVLVLTEGVIPYLTNEEVSSLADSLHSMRRVRFWIVDYLSPQAVAFRRRRRVRQSMQNAPFKFAPDDWFAFFGRHGWRARELHYYNVEGERHLRPMPLPRMAKLMLSLSRWWMSGERREAFRKFGGYALLEPEPLTGAPSTDSPRR